MRSVSFSFWTALLSSFWLSSAFVTVCENFTTISFPIELPCSGAPVIEFLSGFDFPVYDVQLFGHDQLQEEPSLQWSRGNLANKCISKPFSLFVLPPKHDEQKMEDFEKETRKRGVMLVQRENGQNEEEVFRRGTVRVFTSFWEKEEVTIDFTVSINGRKFRVFQDGIVERLMPVQYSLLKYPKSVDEARQNYHFMFNEAHFERNLGFRLDTTTHSKTFILSHPRSGTHVFRRTLEGILDEFIDNFLETNITALTQERIQQTEVGELRGYANTTRIIVEHNIDKIINNTFRVRKVVFLVRNPAEAVDSQFHFRVGGLNHLFKYEGSNYWETKLFFNVMYHRNPTMLANLDFIIENESIPMFLIRYEDQINDPLKAYCDALSFIESIPCSVTWKSKLSSYLKENGLVSFYKKVIVTEENPEEPPPKKRNVLEVFPELINNGIYNVYKYWIHLLDYNEDFRPFVSKKVFEEVPPELKGFRTRNAKWMRKSLEYELTETSIELEMDDEKVARRIAQMRKGLEGQPHKMIDLREEIKKKPPNDTSKDIEKNKEVSKVKKIENNFQLE